MKKILLAGLVYLFMCGSALAVPFTDVQNLYVMLGEGYLTGGETYSYYHSTPADFAVPGSTLDSATLTIDARWVDSSNNNVEVAGVMVGNLLTGTWFSSWSTTTFDIASIFEAGWIAGEQLGVTINTANQFLAGWLKLKTSTLEMEYSPVPEPGTLLLLGSGLAGLALYRRRSMNK